MTRKYLATFIISLASTFYIYDFFVRVAPSVMTGELMDAFHIHAPGLGLLTALLFYAYAFMQIPAGLLFDRYGPRTLLTVFGLICGFATILFALSSSFFTASMGMILIGIGSAFAFIGVLVLAANWAHAKYFALIVGLVQFMGCLGAIFAEEPLAKVVAIYGWRETMIMVGALGVVLGLLYWLFIRDKPAHQKIPRHTKAKISAQDEWRKLKLLSRNPQNWWNGVYAMLLWTPISIFASLWGVPALKSMYGFNIALAARSTSIVWWGVALAGPVVGWWSNYIAKRRLPLIVSAALGLVTSIIFVAIPHMHMWALAICLFIMGASAAGQSVSFGLVQDINKRDMLGTAVGFNNMALIIGTPIAYPLIGLLLQWFWSGSLVNGTPYYSAEDYRLALVSLPIMYLLALLIAMFKLRETHCCYQFKS